LAEYERLSGLSILEYPKRNVITRALGVDQGLGPDMKKIALQPNMIFLLCTDGITRHVSDPEIEEILIEESDPQRACDRLKAVCYERGARDNLTAIVIHLDSLAGRRVRAVTDGESAEARAEELSARQTEIQLPPMPEEKGTRVHGPVSVRVESDSNSAAVIEPRPEVTRPLSIWRKYFAPVLIAVAVTLIVFVVGLYLGRRTVEPRATETTSTASDPPAPADQAHVIFDQGMRSFNRGLYEHAESSFAQAVVLDRANSVYYHWLGRAQMAAGKYGEAAQSFMQALDLRGVEDNLLYASAAYEAAGDQARAHELIEVYKKSQTK
jgi:protein phosphatase